MAHNYYHESGGGLYIGLERDSTSALGSKVYGVTTHAPSTYGTTVSTNLYPPMQYSMVFQSDSQGKEKPSQLRRAYVVCGRERT